MEKIPDTLKIDLQFSYSILSKNRNIGKFGFGSNLKKDNPYSDKFLVKNPFKKIRASFSRLWDCVIENF